MVEFGRHRRLKISRLCRAGSSPAPGTIRSNNVHIELFTVAQKSPPVGEEVFRWSIISGRELFYEGCACAIVSIPENGEEVKATEHPTLMWSTGVMFYEDVWSYTVPRNGP